MPTCVDAGSQFTSVCGGKTSHMLLLCRGPVEQHEEDEDGQAAECWLLVLPASDVKQVVRLDDCAL